MRKNEPNIGVALVKELCPVCGKPMDGPIVMNKRLTKPQKKKVEDMNGKVIGFADHCCEECSKYKDEAVFFVSIDESKSSKDSLINNNTIDNNTVLPIQTKEVKPINENKDSFNVPPNNSFKDLHYHSDDFKPIKSDTKIDFTKPIDDGLLMKNINEGMEDNNFSSI